MLEWPDRRIIKLQVITETLPQGTHETTGHSGSRSFCLFVCFPAGRPFVSVNDRAMMSARSEASLGVPEKYLAFASGGTSFSNCLIFAKIFAAHKQWITLIERTGERASERARRRAS